MRLPFYDLRDNVLSVSWRLGYFKPYYEPLELGSIRPMLWQASSEDYLVSSLASKNVPKPFTRVRFDQSSRRTQLLFVEHAQNFSNEAGIRAVYQRRTRTGEYLGQTTDHYGAGLLLHGKTRRLYGSAQARWNQLFDEINGGSLYDPAQGLAGAFQKESQPVRLPNGRWRLWHRTLQGEAGLVLDSFPDWRVGLRGMIRQTYGGWRSPPARVPTSPFGTDTTTSQTFAFGEEQNLGLRLSHNRFELRSFLLRWWGRGADWQPFDRKAVETQAYYFFDLWSQHPRYHYFYLEALYRYWLSSESPSPEICGTAFWRVPTPFDRVAPAFSIRYSRLALPWLFYQTPFASSLKNSENTWARFNLSVLLGPKHRSAIHVDVWGLRQRWPLLIKKNRLYQPKEGLFWYGLRLSGDMESTRIGFYPALVVQRPIAPDTLRWWVRQIPLVTGWLHFHYRWQILPFKPMYYLGLRVRGNGAHRPPQYEPAYALFFASEQTPLQPTWAAVDVFLTVSLEQVRVYLRVDHAAEGLMAPGSFCAHPYPVPGRAFSFGLVWDVYN